MKVADDMTDTTGYVARSIPIVDQWIQRRETGHMVGLLDGYCYQACESRRLAHLLRSSSCANRSATTCWRI